MEDKKNVYKIAVTGFVPGLPAEITMEEAEALGVADVLREAIKNGNYLPSPYPLPKGRGQELSKGVDHGQ